MAEDGELPSLEGGQQKDLGHTEYSVLPHRRNSFTGIVTGGTIEREKVKKKPRKTCELIEEVPVNINTKALIFVNTPQRVTNAIVGSKITFECQILGQKPIGKLNVVRDQYSNLLLYVKSICV